MSFRKIIRELPVTVALLAVTSVAVLPGMVSAQAAQTPQQVACDSIGGTYTGGNCVTGTGTSSLNTTVSNAIDIFSLIVGIIAIIMIIIGGLKYVTSQGDSSQVSSAKNTIIYAVVGLIVVALAQVIVRFVIAKAG